MDDSRSRGMTGQRRDIRRLAMQVLYLTDLSGEHDADDLMEKLDEEFGSAELRAQAIELAAQAWAMREQADEKISKLTPDWPTHRQPPVDRAILRLAYYEIVSKRSPDKVIINEAVELGKVFAGENSPSFINGVLDKLVRNANAPEDAAETSAETEADAETQAEPESETPAQPETPPTPDVWLNDALKQK